MADLHNGVTGTHSSNISSDNHNHLNTNIESGGFDEKTGHHVTTTNKHPLEDEEEDEDMDALIDELESQDGHAEEEEEDDVNPGTGRVVPEDQLQTDTRIGLTESEVLARRKKYGMNQMKEEKENLILKFLGYFIGPIQFVMEVSSFFSFSFPISAPWTTPYTFSLFWLQLRGPVDLGSGMQVALPR
jgi:H+-transporting ATPase